AVHGIPNVHRHGEKDSNCSAWTTEYRGGGYLCWYITKAVVELAELIILSLTLLVGIGHGFKVYVYMQ
ncbi:hypothetical protein Pcac1_g17194, partial [Phytophthora cactorum]